MPLMAYCPIGQGAHLLNHPALHEVAARHDATTAQVCLAWVLHQDGVIAIPKAVDPAHVRLNAAAAKLALNADDLLTFEQAWPTPKRKQKLAMV